MVARGKMQPVVMRMLTVMLVASLMLAVVSLAWPATVKAWWYYKVDCRTTCRNCAFCEYCKVYRCHDGSGNCYYIGNRDSCKAVFMCCF